MVKMNITELRHWLYVRDLRSARKQQAQKLQNRTFFHSSWTMQDEVKFAASQARKRLLEVSGGNETS